VNKDKAAPRLEFRMRSDITRRAQALKRGIVDFVAGARMGAG